jgi:hypothetical protein
MEDEGTTKCDRCGGRGYDEYYNYGKYYNCKEGSPGFCRCEQGLEWACFVSKNQESYTIIKCEKITGPARFSCFVCHGKGHITWLDKVFEKYNPKVDLFQG